MTRAPTPAPARHAPADIEVDAPAGRARAPALVTLVGGAVIAVAPFLPWAQADVPVVGTVTRSAVEEGGGWWFVAAGVVAAAIAVLTMVVGSRREAQVGQVLLALAVIGAGLWVYSDVSHQFSDIRESVDEATSDVTGVDVAPSELLELQHGAGNYVLLAGAVLVLAGAPRSYVRSARPGG